MPTDIDYSKSPTYRKEKEITSTDIDYSNAPIPTDYSQAPTSPFRERINQIDKLSIPTNLKKLLTRNFMSTLIPGLGMLPSAVSTGMELGKPLREFAAKKFRQSEQAIKAGVGESLRILDEEEIDEAGVEAFKRAGADIGSIIKAAQLGWQGKTDITAADLTDEALKRIPDTIKIGDKVYPDIFKPPLSAVTEYATELYTNPSYLSLAGYGFIASKVNLYNKLQMAASPLMPKFMKRWFVPHGATPKEFRALREDMVLNIIRGTNKAEEVLKKMTVGLSKAEQLRLGQIMRGGITTNPKYTALTKEARGLIDALSKEYVKLGIPTELTAEIIKGNLGVYLPRLYKMKEMPGELGKILGMGKKLRMNLNNLKQRKDIPFEIRQAMGEMLEAGYPTAKAIAQMTDTVEKYKMLEIVSKNPKWVSSVTKEGFTKMPQAKEWGKLAGKYVAKDIADDLAPSNWTALLKNGWWGKFLAAWKYGKVVLNPATHCRNVVSNSILLDLSGVSHLRQSGLMIRAIRNISKNGALFQEAKNGGLFGKEFVMAEMGPFVKSFSDARGPAFVRLFKAGAKAPGRIYQNEERLFKFMKFISERSKGRGVAEAVSEGHKWLFNYAEVGTAIEWARRSLVGMPFITFTYKAIPRIGEALINNPAKLYKYHVLFRFIEGKAQETLGLTDEEMKLLKKGKWKGIKLVTGTRDKNGTPDTLDLSYSLPWGMLSEAGGLFGLPATLSPLATPLKPVFEVGINRNVFTNKPIYTKEDSWQEIATKVADHLAKNLGPSFTPGPKVKGEWTGGWSWIKLVSALEEDEKGKGRPDYFGRVRNLKKVLLDIVFGVKLSGVTPKEIKSMKGWEIKKRKEALMDEYRKIQMRQDVSEEYKKHTLKRTKEKMKNLMQEWKQFP